MLKRAVIKRSSHLFLFYIPPPPPTPHSHSTQENLKFKLSSRSPVSRDELYMINLAVFNCFSTSQLSMKQERIRVSKCRRRPLNHGREYRIRH